jgi:hypothetical protein
MERPHAEQAIPHVHTVPHGLHVQLHNAIRLCKSYHSHADTPQQIV